MAYITIGEAAKKWGISKRAGLYHLAAGRVPGAVKQGNLWMIPEDAPRPADKRRRGTEEVPVARLCDDLRGAIGAVALLPTDDLHAILGVIRDEQAQLIHRAFLSYLWGDFAQVLDCYRKANRDDLARLAICTVAPPAAASMGDYDTYTEIDAWLKGICAAIGTNDADTRSFAEMALAAVPVSMYAVNMVPEWLKAGDFGALPLLVRPNALYLRVKYFRCIKDFDAMLHVARTALTLSPEGALSTMTDIYLGMSCAVACHALGRDEEATCFLLSAMRAALPHGYITPFAEMLPDLGGLVERHLQWEFPDQYDAVVVQCRRTIKNWIGFHNRFAKDNIPFILSLRETHIAVQAARGVSCKQIAQQQGLSVGRVRNIIQEVYAKLLINDREGLRRFIL